MNKRHFVALAVGVVAAFAAAVAPSHPTPVSSTAGPTILGAHTEMVVTRVSFMPDAVFLGVMALTAVAISLLRSRNTV